MFWRNLRSNQSPYLLFFHFSVMFLYLDLSFWQLFYFIILYFTSVWLFITVKFISVHYPLVVKNLPFTELVRINRDPILRTLKLTALLLSLFRLELTILFHWWVKILTAAIFECSFRVTTLVNMTICWPCLAFLSGSLGLEWLVDLWSTCHAGWRLGWSGHIPQWRFYIVVYAILLHEKFVSSKNYL